MSDLLSDEALAEVRRVVADAQRGKKSQRASTEHDIRQTEAAIARVTEAIAETGLSRALREKLRELESKRDKLEARRRVSDVDDEAVQLVPRVVEGWRSLVDHLEDLGRHPDARPEDVEEARERLSNLIGVRIVPERGELVAEVGLRALESGLPYIPVVAGVGFEPTTFGL